MPFDTSGKPIFGGELSNLVTLLHPAGAATASGVKIPRSNPLQPPVADRLSALVSGVKAPRIAPWPEPRNGLDALVAALQKVTKPAPALTQTAQGLAAKVIASARSQLGVPYVWGGTAWGKGLDCSGLVQQALARNGIKIGRTTYEQWKEGIAVDRSQLQPGDVVFFHPGKNGPEHEALYIGNGQIIEAPHTGATVRISSLAGRSDYMGARRFS
jgi:cell wall-associated NlpC family hydrolase